MFMEMSDLRCRPKWAEGQLCPKELCVCARVRVHVLASLVGEWVHGQACRATGTTSSHSLHTSMQWWWQSLNSFPLPSLHAELHPMWGTYTHTRAHTQTHTHTPQLFCTAVFICLTKTLRHGGAIAFPSTPATRIKHTTSEQVLVDWGL